MTTKPKTRKAWAPETISKKIETYQELEREADEIARLVSVWHFIEAEQRLLKLTKMKYPLRDEATRLAKGDGAAYEGGRMTMLAQALARHKAAEAAIDAAQAADQDGNHKHLTDAEFEAIDNLAETPCSSDAEFIEKLRYLHAYETRFFGVPTGQHEFRSVVLAVDCHFPPVNA
jgi:hypothetical protein